MSPCHFALCIHAHDFPFMPASVNIIDMTCIGLHVDVDMQIKANGVPVQQLWCNSDIYHFDLSYWAFQQLAHPTYGVMMVDFRYITFCLPLKANMCMCLVLSPALSLLLHPRCSMVPPDNMHVGTLYCDVSSRSCSSALRPDTYSSTCGNTPFD